MFRLTSLFLAALSIGLLATDAKACNRVCAAVAVQQVSYAQPVAVQQVALVPQVQSYAVMPSFAQVQAVSYAAPVQSFAVQSYAMPAFAANVGYGGFSGRAFPVAGFNGGFGGGAGFRAGGGGGGLGLGGLVNAVGNVANSPAGLAALGFLAGRAGR
jgi:hypothetical protein